VLAQPDLAEPAQEELEAEIAASDFTDDTLAEPEQKLTEQEHLEPELVDSDGLQQASSSAEEVIQEASIEDELDDEILADLSLESALAEDAESSQRSVAPSIEDIESMAEDEEDFAQAIESMLQEPTGSEVDTSDELDDVPGLDEWLTEPSEFSEANEDESILEEIESADFDELLESLDEDMDVTAPSNEQVNELDNPALDLDALLSEETDDEASLVDIPAAQGEDVEGLSEDFLDVEALLTESVEAESDPMLDAELNLDVALDEFTGVTGDEDVIDVDGDQGVGAKLDLARAYIEIDDVESAKELLQDIAESGEQEQQQEAQSLLDKL